MRIYPFYSVKAFSNTYLLGPEGGGDAILVDPGAMDLSLLELIEDHHYTIRWILITHAHEGHCGGVPTVKRIYDPEILASSPVVAGYHTTPLADGNTLDLAGFRIRCREIPGHSGDSLCYESEGFLFTGDVLGAGTLGPTPNAYARALMIREVRALLGEQAPDTQVLPGHGPPSTSEIEQLTNPALTATIPDGSERP